VPPYCSKRQKTVSFEIRVLSINGSSPAAGKTREFAQFQISRIAPGVGIRAGFVEYDESNRPFQADEIKRITTSLNTVREAAHTRTDITPAQLDLLDRKLDEMSAGANRLGKRDWINLAVGTLTNIAISASLNSDFTRFLFQSAGAALQWLFGATVKLLM
jgi:hypothetical protein